MKKKILIPACILAVLGLRAQPVLEHIYTESVNVCELESVGMVYYSMDVINKQCHIYRMDHSLYKSIPIPAPEGYYLSDVRFVSEKLFNTDALIELAYSYEKYVPTGTSYYYTYETKVVNENGSVLLTVPGAGFTNVIDVPGEGKKFLVYEYNFSVIPYRTYTHVYALPESATKAGEYSISAIGEAHAYPNPAGGSVTIPLELPEGTSSAVLELFSSHGQKIMTHPVSGPGSSVVVPTDQLVPGTYLYRVDYGSGVSPAKKVVIRK